MPKSVIVIGAGPSGLVAAKEMLEAGFEVTTFEMSHGVGGVFRIDNEETYDGLYLTITNAFMSYSDYPMKTATKGQVLYPSKASYGQYLNDYADEFKVRDTIIFRTEVVKAALDNVGRWRVVVKNRDTGKESTHEADALLVATGCHATPKVPDFKGYTGKIRHAKQFKNANDLGDKRVLVVGGNESAADITAEVAANAGSAFCWLRKKPICAPRFPSKFGDPFVSYDEFAVLKAGKPNKVKDVLEGSVITRYQNLLPYGIYGLQRQLLWRASTQHVGSRWGRDTSWNYFWMADQCQAPNKTNRLAHAVEIGKLNAIVAPTAMCEGKTVTLQKATFKDFKDCKECDVSIEVDEIICATGYKNDFAWLEADIEWNARAWYKHCFPPNPKFVGKLMFIGWCRPHAGGIPQCAEIASRYTAQILKGERQLPKNMTELIEKERLDEEKFYPKSVHIDNLMDYVSYMESVAELIGCVPPEPNIITSPFRWLKYWFLPNWPCCYRITGPGANPTQAYKVLDSFEFFSNIVDHIFFLFLPVQVFFFSAFLVQMFVNAVLLSLPFNLPLVKSGTAHMYFKSKISVLHGNGLKRHYVSKPILAMTLGLVGAIYYKYVH